MQLVSSAHQLMIVGDFNYHMDSATDSNSVSFLNVISSLNLQQHVQFPTHTSGHTLDLVLTRANDNFISNVSSTSYLPSDHVAVICSMNIRKPKPIKVKIRTRKIQQINIEAFRQDILLSELYSFSSDNVNEQVDQFEYSLSSLLDKHAPEVTRIITSRPESPWYCDDLRQLKRELRALERKAFPNGLEIDRENFRKAAHHYSNQLGSARSKHHRDQLRECTPRELFKKVEQLTRPTTSLTIPTTDGTGDSLAERFVMYFAEKVENITHQLQSSTSNATEFCFVEEPYRSSSFGHFRTVTDEEVRSCIMKSSSTTCDLDPIPTPFLKKFLDELVPIMTTIVNDSFVTGCVPDKFKCANILPKLKGNSLNTEELKNYRPIANLRF